SLRLRLHFVTVGRFECQAIDFFELLDFSKCGGRESGLAFKRVQNDAFEEVTEREVFEFGEGFKHFEKAFFDANASLDAVDENGLDWLHGIYVPWYIRSVNHAVCLSPSCEIKEWEAALAAAHSTPSCEACIRLLKC